MTGASPRRPAAESDYAKAMKHVQTLKGQFRSMQQELGVARRDRDAAEASVRSLTLELRKARQRIAELEALTASQGDR